jgi:hypothetical protein
MLRRHRRDAHVELRLADFDRESSVLRQALFRYIQARHELESRHQGARDAIAFEHLFLQHAVDALPDAQARFAGLDMNIGSADLDGVDEHGLQKPQHGRIGGAVIGGQLLQIDIALAQIVAHFLHQRGDLVGAPVDDIEHAQQLAFADDRDAQRLFQPLREFVIGKQIRRIRHADQQAAFIGLQHQRPKASRERLGQLSHDLRIERHLAQVHIRQLQMTRERLMQRVLAEHAEIGKHAPQLATGALLLLERLLELFGRDYALFEQHLAESDALFRAVVHL